MRLGVRGIRVLLDGGGSGCHRDERCVSDGEDGGVDSKECVERLEPFPPPRHLSLWPRPIFVRGESLNTSRQLHHSKPSNTRIKQLDIL